MQYLYENFTFPADQSFTVRSDIVELKTHTILKSHVNFEIALLENCIGKHFIGDHIEDFQQTELVLLGSYVPHCWQYYQAIDPMIQPHAVVIHFFPDFLGKELLQKPEAKKLNELFDKAAMGISFTGQTVLRAKMVMQQMLFEKGLGRAASMLRLLDILAQSDSAKVLSSPYFNAAEGSGDAKKINKIFDYIFSNFQKNVSLHDVSGLIFMSPASFCRFFKQKTNRTLSDFVKEIRIGHAARLLMEGRHNVTEACHNSGYNNISNFNKHFREIKRLSPREFIKRYQVNE